MTTCTSNQSLIFGPDPLTFRVCSFLVNVLSNMYDQWKTAGKPGPDQFDWTPVDSCLVPTELKVGDFKFFPLIWSKYKWALEERTEPFGCYVRSLTGNLFLVFRGSKTIADFCVDTETALVSYQPPPTKPPFPFDMRVEQGWYKVYNGIFQTLADQREQFGAGTKITITGHSLGSTLSTLVVPDFVAAGFEVQHYNTASPLVGNDAFRTYYESLQVRDSSRGFLEGTFRLVNTADTVPNFPNKPGYVHVGTRIAFNADYSADTEIAREEKVHNPCCSYAYAIHHPDEPCNTTFDDCNIPID